MDVDPLLARAFPVPGLQPDWEAALLKALGYAGPALAERASPSGDSGPVPAGPSKKRSVLGVRWG